MVYTYTRPRVQHLARGATAALLLLAAVTGCSSEPETIATSEWVDTVFTPRSTELLALVAEGDGTTGSRPPCEGVAKWAKSADAEPRPKDADMAAAFDRMVAWGSEYGGEGCLTRSASDFEDQLVAMVPIIDELEAAIKAS